MKFEWDETKRASNLAKHMVDFELAKEVFNDPCRIEIEDKSMDYGEARFIVIGFAADVLLTVIYTDRDKCIRIISARRATPKERRLYHETSV
jgi:uncharacterized DUF497 family protein